MGSAILALALLAAPVAAKPTWSAASFDQPLTIRTVKAPPGTDPIAISPPERICTIYGDLMIREVGTDSADPDPVTIVRKPASGTDACAPGPDKAVAGETKIATGGLSLLGRKGPYLFLEATDPNGATPFVIIDAETGRSIYSDATKDADIKAMSFEAGVLRLRYKRGINSACSVLADSTGCWAKMARTGDITGRIAQGLPPLKACRAAYKKGKVTVDDPSLIFYDVDVTLAPDGKVDMQPHGAVGCEPMP